LFNLDLSIKPSHDIINYPQGEISYYFKLKDWIFQVFSVVQNIILATNGRWLRFIPIRADKVSDEKSYSTGLLENGGLRYEKKISNFNRVGKYVRYISIPGWLF